MAQQTIHHVCGHAEKIGVFGPMKDREWKLDRERSTMCFECFRAAELAAAQAKSADLPELTGSEKQITWATSIRVKLLGEIDTFVAQVTAEGRVTDQAAVDRIVRCIRRQTKAPWWIDQRSTPAPLILSAIGKALAAADAAKEA